MNPLLLLTVTVRVAPEYVFRDHLLGYQYIAQTPRCPQDIVCAFRIVTTTEREWFGVHPDGIVTTTSEHGPTSTTAEVELGEWMVTP